MGRYCSECQEFCQPGDFSRSQWCKGQGFSRCIDCVNTPCSCQTCGRDFNSQNQLKMHMQTHRPRTVACPICGDSRFASGANAVQHVESGSCTGCLGKDNARRQIHKFVSRKSQMNSFMTPMLEYGGYGANVVPEFPYHCAPCNKKFRQMSQLLQHQDQKHNNRLSLTNY